MMEMNRDEHLKSRHEMYQLDNGPDDIYVSPALAHRRAGDPNLLTLAPGCPLCEASRLSFAEAWEAVREAAAAGKLTDGAKD